MSEKVTGIIDNVDRQLVRDSVVLQNLLVMLQKSGAELKIMGTLLERAYAMSQRVIEDMVVADGKVNRAALKDRDIKVYREEQQGLVIYYYFTCRGREERFGVTRDVLRSEISLRLSKYVSELGKMLKDTGQHA
ncbi:hypothetical protein [Paenibacillus brevis]|uniref:Uncharacterized protein n=1 Tax=Paenibacillus brevis TaxID=2841508 RepID=A0ABS6FRK6_9BACL|nr:hypothetical protein [Paenibacillus brevis]MBU5672663.1 hypothetical protein [Paenibacillus brevis]